MDKDELKDYFFGKKSSINSELKISRSAYQKVVEQNKRLISDIKILTGYTNLGEDEKQKLIKEWIFVFEKEKSFNSLIKELLKVEKNKSI